MTIAFITIAFVALFVGFVMGLMAKNKNPYDDDL